MSRTSPSALAPALAVVLAAGLAAGLGCGLAGCGDGDEDVRRPVPELVIPSETAQRAEDRMLDARRLLRAGAPREAEPVLREVLELDPTATTAVELLADWLLEDDRYEEVLALISEDHLIREPLLVRYVGSAYDHLDDLPAAEAAFLEWLELDPQNDDALFLYGSLLYRKGDLPGAARAFRRAERRAASRADVRTEHGLVLLAMGRRADAEQKQADAVERDPTNSIAWFRLGDAISRDEEPRPREAIEALETSVSLEPSYLPAQLYLYRLLHMEKQFGGVATEDELRRRWRAILRQAGPRLLRRHGLPDAVNFPGDIDRIEARTRERLAESPDDPELRLRLAHVLHAQGYARDAQILYDELIGETATPSAILLDSAGGAALELGDAAAGGAHLERVLVLDPRRPGLWRRLGFAHLLAGDLERALLSYDSALAASSDDAIARLGRGLTMLRSGDVDGGLHEVAAAGW